VDQHLKKKPAGASKSLAFDVGKADILGLEMFAAVVRILHADQTPEEWVLPPIFSVKPFDALMIRRCLEYYFETYSLRISSITCDGCSANAAALAETAVRG
jgi:hypothetical protein